MKVKLNDQVQVIAGKYKNKEGKVIRILRKQERIVVEKINMRTKFTKKTANKPGDKIQFEAPLHVSNVMVLCPLCNKRTRVGYKKLENGKKQRTCKKCSESLDKVITKA